MANNKILIEENEEGSAAAATADEPARKRAVDNLRPVPVVSSLKLPTPPKLSGT